MPTNTDGAEVTGIRIVNEPCAWDADLEAIRIITERDPVGRVVCYTASRRMTALVMDSLTLAGGDGLSLEVAS